MFFLTLKSKGSHDESNLFHKYEICSDWKIKVKSHV